MGGNLIDALLLFVSESPQTLAAQGLAGAASFLPSQMVRAFITDSKAKRVSVNPLQTPALVAATDLIVHIREHLPILLGTRVTAFREPQNRKAAK